MDPLSPTVAQEIEAYEASQRKKALVYTIVGAAVPCLGVAALLVLYGGSISSVTFGPATVLTLGVLLAAIWGCYFAVLRRRIESRADMQRRFYEYWEEAEADKVATATRMQEDSLVESRPKSVVIAGQ